MSKRPLAIGISLLGLLFAASTVPISVGGVDARNPQAALEGPMGGNCASGGLKFGFTGGGWVANSSPLVDLRYGIGTSFNAKSWMEEWREARTWNGGQQSVLESAGEIWIWFEELGSTAGTSDCGAGFIKLDNRYRVDPYNSTLAAEAKRVLQHEAGHTLGLYHVGRQASHDGQIPVMATCLTPSQRRSSIIGSDERAAWIYHNDSGIGTDSPLSNPGFELNSYAWGGSNVSYVGGTAHKRSGQRGMWLRPTAAGGFYQTVTTISSGSLAKTTRPSIYAREVSSGVTGRTTLEAWFQKRNYALTSSNCHWWSGRNENDENSPGPLEFLGSRYLYLSTSWSEIAVTGYPKLSSAVGNVFLVVKPATQKERQLVGDSSR